MRSVLSILLIFVLVMADGIPAKAAGHPEITVIPVGQLALKRGEQEVIHRLPRGVAGPLPQPLVLIAAQPRVSPDKDEDKTGDKASAPKATPATLRITVGDKQLPDWVLDSAATAYVINLDTVRTNPRYAVGAIAMKITLLGEAPSASVSVLGMPDPMLLDSGSRTALNGPLSHFAEQAKDPNVKAYFTALMKDVAGRRREAKAAYETLAKNAGGRVARFARRSLRMLSYQLRKRKLSGNFMEHYRWGLYLQFCGLFDAAFREFEECRILDSAGGEGDFRAGQCLDRIGGRLDQYIHYMARAGESSGEKHPIPWYTLVVIVKGRDKRLLSQAEIDRIKDRWLFMDRMLFGATRGVVRLVTSFYEVEAEPSRTATPGHSHLEWPDDDMIETRGWYDSVICVRPRLKNEDRTLVEIGGADVGPNGAALAAVFHDAGWTQYLKAIYGHLRWAAEVSEAGPGLPSVDDLLDCGLQPAPNEGYVLRAALRDHFARQTLRGLQVAKVPTPGSYLQLWKIEGPYPVKATGNQRRPGRHVLDPIPAGPPPQTLHVVSNTDFIDLAKLMPFAGWVRTRATSWVYVPQDQPVRMWLGQNDGIAVWLNGRCVHAGRHYATGKFADRNLVDTISTIVNFKAGWNTLQVVAESWPKPQNKRYGFSVGLTTLAGKPIPALACVYEPPTEGLAAVDAPPEPGRHYDWSKVKPDFLHRLPRLTATELQTITGVKGLAITADLKLPNGAWAVTAPDLPVSNTYRPWSGSWNAAKDRDVVLNNLMDWAREACAAFGYQGSDGRHDLLFLKPEAIEAFLTLLHEPKEAQTLFEGRPPSNRVLGYVVVPAGRSTRTLLVLDTLLGDDARWPTDEEDILVPLGPYVPNRSPKPTTAPAASPKAQALRSSSSN